MTRSLVKLLETQVNESDTSSFEVGEQRERNHRYYSLQPLGNEIKGRSHYVSPDVLDTVESKKAVFSETFLSSRDVVKFSNCPYQGEAESKTAYVNRTFKRNKYERLFRDGWHDAFVAKRMVVLAEWYRDTAEQTVTLNSTPMPELQAMLSQAQDIIDVDDSQLSSQVISTPQGVLEIVSGDLTVVVDDSYCRLTLIPPESFFRDPEASYLDEGQWCTFEETVARGTLIEEGYSYDQVMGLAIDYRFKSQEEDVSRKAHDRSWTQRSQENRASVQELVTRYRTWTWLDSRDEDSLAGLDYEPKEGVNLYEIHWAAGELLTWEDGSPAIRAVDEMQFFEWAEMKISHAEHGMCTADVVSHAQKTSSVLKRLIIDNQTMANSGRMLAMNNQLRNPRDLVDNKIGATIWTKRMDSVAPLPIPQLSPLTLETISMMKQETEERSGISGLAKGMNTDAVRYQNADNMVERLTTAGQRRVTAAARDFANTFLVPLSQFIVTLAKKYDTGSQVMEIGGQQRQIVPAQWQDDDNAMDIAYALTPEEAQKAAQSLLTMDGLLKQDEDMKAVYGVQQKFALYDMVFDLLGVSDASPFLLSPESPEYRQKAMQSDQMADVMAKKAEEERSVALQSTIAQIQSLQSSDQREWQKLNWQVTNEMADNTREDEKLDWDIERQKEELRIEEEQKRGVGIG